MVYVAVTERELAYLSENVSTREITWDVVQLLLKSCTSQCKLFVGLTLDKFTVSLTRP